MGPEKGLKMVKNHTFWTLPNVSHSFSDLLYPKSSSMGAQMGSVGAQMGSRGSQTGVFSAKKGEFGPLDGVSRTPKSQAKGLVETQK